VFFRALRVVATCAEQKTEVAFLATSVGALFVLDLSITSPVLGAPPAGR
jgi:hypothetical protein